MPFKSEKQRRYMHAKLPEIAKRWERDYASGGIARIPLQVGGLPFNNPIGGVDQFSKEVKNLERGAYPIGGTSYWVDQLGGTLQDYFQNKLGLNPYRKVNVTQPPNMSSAPIGENIYGMDEMFAYPEMQQNNMISNMEGMKPLALDIMTGKYKYGVGPDGKPYQQPRTIADQNRVLGQTFTKQQPAWYNRMFNKVGEGITGLKNKFTGAYDQSQNFIRNIMDNTLIGRIAAGFDATNPKAFNYNPALQGQIDFLKGKGQYGVMDPSGLNKITRGVLAGKNLQSMFGSNDLGAMYDKSIARTQKTLANLSKKWSRLKEEDPEEYAKKEAYHRALLQKKKNEKKQYFDTLKKKTTSGDGKKNYITKIDQSGKGDGGGGKGSWGGHGSVEAYDKSQAETYARAKDRHNWSQGGIVSLWPK